MHMEVFQERRREEMGLVDEVQYSADESGTLSMLLQNPPTQFVSHSPTHPNISPRGHHTKERNFLILCFNSLLEGGVCTWDLLLWDPRKHFGYFGKDAAKRMDQNGCLRK